MSTTQTTPSPSNEGIAKRRVFDLEKFEKTTVEVKYQKPEALKEVSAAQEYLSGLGDKVVSLVNKMREREAMIAARKTIQGVNPKIVNQMVNVFRMLPPYSEMLEKGSDGEVTKESRKKQTAAIYAFIRSNDQILNSLKAAMTVEEDDEDETEEGEEE